ncbi:MAG: hypothetical protein VSS52_012395, partial [Thiotrichaceae bacterium]|nr:hypothetical protein [Thiotrichaceae bacterium]
KGFLELGLQPTTLQEGLLLEVENIAEQYAYRCDRSKILCKSYWTSEEKHSSKTSKVFNDINKSDNQATTANE